MLALPAVAPFLLAFAAAGPASGPEASAPGFDSPRTLVVAVEVDRDQARLLGWTVKDRPFRAAAAAEPGPRFWGEGGSVQVEVTLLGPGGARFVRRVDAGPICLEHDPASDSHVDGDRIVVHRDSLLVELPELAGFDAVEVAYHDGDGGHPVRRLIGFETLDAARFTAAGGSLAYDAVVFATVAAGAASDGAAGATGGGSSLRGPVARTSGSVFWPEDFGETVDYVVYGNEAEASQRINIVLVPDGYTHAEKATMEAHAQDMVNRFRATTPYAEHDPFINYILVYAYSTDSGTDQCDCSIVKDTAMNTRFTDAWGPCGDVANRCLYYGTGNGGTNCDPNTSSANITAAELRAPRKDTTIILVNTARYGGCGGTRSVYAAANASGSWIAVHELGHSLAGLADEYVDLSGCASPGSGVNYSDDGTSGSWPEWVPTVGAPRLGSHRYPSCVYRPTDDCDMRTLAAPFCSICNQRWSLVFYGHANVSPTAPIAGHAPASPVAAVVGTPVDFSLTTRLATGPLVSDAYTWQVTEPGGSPMTVSTAPSPFQHTFTRTGQHTVTCQLVAATNFIKPSKNGANVDTVSWTVNVGAASCDPLPVFAGITAAVDADPCGATGITLTWDPATFGSSGGSYEVWRDGTRIAAGVTGSPYLDRPGNAAVHSYRIAAVTADCSLRDGNAVSLAASDGRATPPVFAGIAGASDRDACQQDGVQLTWTPATFGVAGGSYQVWRDGAVVSTGVPGTPWIEVPGDGLPHTWRVNAVSADCGVSDGNSATLSATDGSGPASLPTLGDIVSITKSPGGTLVTWSDVPGVSNYEVGRSEWMSFAGPVFVVGTSSSGAVGVTDADPFPGPGGRTYRVAATSCGMTGGY